MHSGSHGQGCDRKLKEAKRLLGQSSHKPEKKKKKEPDRLTYDPA
jgi:hypothetical protein